MTIEQRLQLIQIAATMVAGTDRCNKFYLENVADRATMTSEVLSVADALQARLEIT